MRRFFTITWKAPHDFGGIHDMYAVIDGVQVADGGFLDRPHGDNDAEAAARSAP